MLGIFVADMLRRRSSNHKESTSMKIDEVVMNANKLIGIMIDVGWLAVSTETLQKA